MAAVDMDDLAGHRRVAHEEQDRGRDLALSPLFADVVLAPVLARLIERHPGARVDVRLSHGYAEIFDERVDVALRRGPLRDSTSLHARRLGMLSMTCVAVPRLPLPTAAQPEVRASELPWIRVGPRLEPMAIPLRIGARPRTVLVSPRIAVDSQQLALALAERGLGVARVNGFLAREALARGTLVEILPEANATEAVYAVYPRRDISSGLLRDFIAILVDVCRGLAIWD